MSDPEKPVPRPDAAIVLAAGKGTRMGHPTLPKPLVAVGGRPMLERVLTALSRAGYRRAVLVVGFRGDLIREHCGERCCGLEIGYVLQETQDGTAAAVALAAPAVAGEEAVLVTWTDILVSPAYYDLLTSAWTHRPGLTALTTVLTGDPSVGALVTFDADLRMQDVLEKPAGVTKGWADGGVSILSREALAAMAAVEPSARGEKELADGLRSLLAAGRLVGVERLAGPWMDLASPAHVAEAERRFGDLLGELAEGR